MVAESDAGIAVPSEIKNSKDGIAYCNEQIRKAEELEKKCLDLSDIKTASRYGGWKVKWMELLQMYIRMDWQQGGQVEDASKIISDRLKPKKNGRPRTHWK